MAQFDVYRMTGEAIPFAVDVQSDYLDIAQTRVVVPFARLSAYRGKTLAGLNPEFEIASVRVILLPTQIATVPRRLLTERVASLARERDRIVRAIDTLLLGV